MHHDPDAPRPKADRSHPRALIAVAVIVLSAVVVATAMGSRNDATSVAASATDLTRLPVGDGKVSLTGARRGYVYACSAGNPNAGGAFKDGPWIDKANNTFNASSKATVDGKVDWPQAKVTFTRSGSRLTVSGNGLPTNRTTGAFPISSSDDAFGYDRNPNRIAAQSVSYTLPRARAAAKASCVNGGPIGIALNGVAIFNALDGANRDAVAHETLDSCQGHPERSGTYHYHAMPICLWKSQSSTRQSGLFGYALDGYPIYGPRGSGGKLLTDADLDACHGRTATVTLNGRRVRTYHYVATLEYPYTVGCYHGTAITTGRQGPP